ncbi:MAG: urease accessory protein UreH domain-containing protein [Candidatus Hodarchaeales archaeon]|jgi:high-affinity nickel permease
MVDFPSTLGLWTFAILLGIKHSFDADHLVAVTSVLSNAPNTKYTTKLSISWALGHMVTASLLTIILFSFKETLLKEILANAELLVPFMLIGIALVTLAWEFDLLHFHRHEHSQAEESKEHTHLHLHFPKLNEHGTMVGIGIIHGLASNDELLLLFTLTLGINELWAILVGVMFFTIGVIGGMVTYGWLINFPNKRWGEKRVTRVVNISIAVVTLAYATWLLLGLEGINIVEFLTNLF